ncbi:MAG: hypothetical protein ACMXX7_02155 [Candidatus Woesearchaeota archaeon]
MTECAICEQIVTNPICQSCTNTTLNEWLKQNELETFDLVLYSKTEDKCFKCKKDLAICRYCHTEIVLDWLVGKGISQELKKEFLQVFHFDLHKKGYLLKYAGYID